ncbi:MAG: hypothetical protein K1X86_00140 [Ignavibacteria bacterium]|nr:hypothetical protein [Ignavibacteria bacterium]
MDKISLMKWIDSSDLVYWAQSKGKDAEQYISLLVRYLIRETIVGIKSMRFPAGDATRFSGWDGILITDSSLTSTPEFIPQGISFWEFGTGEDYLTKANKDYKERTENNKGYDLKNSTFVFVTPRVWEDDSKKNAKKKKSKNDWINEKLAEGIFKNVIIYDARDLEEWIQKCPNAGIWLANKIGKFPPSGIEPLTDFWERWSINPSHTLTPELVVAGRKANMEKLTAWLNNGFSAYSLKSLTREEAVAFLYATIAILPTEEMNYFLERCIIIKDMETFVKFSKIHSNYILINYFNVPSAADFAASRNNHVFIPVTPDNSTTSNDELNTLGIFGLIKELKKIGFEPEEARQLSKDSGKSLSVLRSLLKFRQQKPEWTKHANVPYLLTVLLVGNWDDNNDADKATVAELSNTSYEEFINKITEFNNSEDPPTFKIGNIWGMRSQYYTWFLLAGSLIREILKRYFEIVNKVLFEIDPEFELDEDDRYKAQLLGVKRVYSGWLRDGLLNSLILLSIYGDKTQHGFIGVEVDNFINKLLLNANEERWFSVATMLPQLAEASPEAFLSNIEKAINMENPPIKVLFREGDDALTARCNHSGLMWALESLAWDEQYLTRVTLILGKLFVLQTKKSRYTNNPKNTLKNIFLGWMPNTTANIENRIIALRALVDQNVEVGFKILLKLLPTEGGVAFPTSKMHWRGFGEFTRDKSNDAIKSESEYFNLALEVANLDGSYLAKLVPYYDNLHMISDRVKLYEHIEKNIPNITHGLTELKEAIRKLITKIKSYPNEYYFITHEVLSDLEKLYALFPVGNIIDENKWIFDEYFPNLDIPRREHHAEYETKLREERISIITRLYNEIKLQRVIDLSENVKEPYFMGQSLAESNLPTDHEEQIILKLLLKEKNEFAFAQGYVVSKIYGEGKIWINRIIAMMREKRFLNAVIIKFLILLEFNRDTWQIVESFDDEIQKGYWESWNGRLFKLSSDDSLYAYEKLLSHKRFVTLVEELSFDKINAPTSIIVRVLKGAATERAVEPWRTKFDPYRIADLFKILDERNYNDERIMVDLEWLYADILTDEYLHRPPKLLHSEMARNPNFFMDIIKCIYKPTDDTDMEKEETKNLDEETIKRRSHIGWNLLHSLRIIPGSTGNKIDYEILKSWVDEVISLSIDCKRENIVKDKIGELLAYSDINGNQWPPAEVCKILEHLSNDIVDEAFIVSKRNQRGTVTKSVYEGGEQELGMEDNYNNLAKSLNPKYVRTVKVLKSIASSYRKEAIVEDERAEQDKISN